MAQHTTTPKPSLTKTPKESFVRWQGITMAQLGYTGNLFLTFAAAALGFALTLLKEKEFVLQRWGKGFFTTSLGLSVFSLGTGTTCALIRLWDFRNTTEIAKDRQELETTDDGIVELARRRAVVRCLDQWVRVLLTAQVIIFALAVIALLLSLSIVYEAKLF